MGKDRVHKERKGQEGIVYVKEKEKDVVGRSKGRSKK